MNADLGARRRRVDLLQRGELLALRRTGEPASGTSGDLLDHTRFAQRALAGSARRDRTADRVVVHTRYAAGMDASSRVSADPEHDLPDVLARFDDAVRRGGRGERQDPVDDGPHGSGLDQRPDVLAYGGDDGCLLRPRPATE